MSDKYKEMAERFLACCKTFFYPGPLVSDVALIADAMRYCAAKLEEEREKETCETCFQHKSCGIEQMIHFKGFFVPDQPFWCNRHRRVEKESVIAPTSKETDDER